MSDSYRRICKSCNDVFMGLDEDRECPKCVIANFGAFCVKQAQRVSSEAEQAALIRSMKLAVRNVATHANQAPENDDEDDEDSEDEESDDSSVDPSFVPDTPNKTNAAKTLCRRLRSEAAGATGGNVEYIIFIILFSISYETFIMS